MRVQGIFLGLLWDVWAGLGCKRLLVGSSNSGIGVGWGEDFPDVRGQRQKVEPEGQQFRCMS